jgi:DNA-binding transcriptional MerR regulator
MRLSLKKTYTAREVAGLTGLTARQLQWLDSRKIVSPSISPRRTDAGGYTERRYSPVELLELLVLSDLRQRGFTPAQLLRLVEALRGQFGIRLFEATGGGAPVRLLTDGREIFARTSSGEMFNLLRAPTQPLLVIGEEGRLKELDSRLRPRRRRTATPRRARRDA